ncbi:hypothetical protein [Caldovatus aquaticus]|uniref:LytR/CpsA/Psr regulator C-terminal domain-containing protein n=1 Tax=Caldovatus aquaticus TaxID=2865671 RepID=A0ABS7F6C9_9PROT|nr:hypothetical protein [Caldovatus aquaticus]MBW8270868.1 hypothetical protein [Caldovatus aquaticus]
MRRPRPETRRSDSSARGDARGTATLPGADLAAAGAPELSAELARLRAAVAAERARLAALERQRAALLASTETLRREAAPAAAAARRAEGALAAAEPNALRIFVHYRAGSPLAEHAAAELAAALHEAGLEVAGFRPAAAVPAVRPVRYYHADDAPIAAGLAAQLGRGWVAQDFHGLPAAPPARTLEIWVPER